ncbi:MAG TPA: NrfD/PsrC family molybdoenzyme membrane anchor subunit [Terriglobales bacterium]
MSDPVYQLPNEYSQRGWKLDKEARLVEIRERAKELGTVDAKGVVPSGAPFPIASPESGYYGIPLLKQPQWNPAIPIYFFVGGASGACAVIGAIANWTHRNPKVARDARMVAAVGAILSSGLLISDLGRPSRFLNMLRVIKLQSPMSVGAWVLAGFGTFSGAAAAAQILTDRFGFGAFRIIGNVAEGFSVLFGLPFSNYTGVLIGATVIPVWNHNVRSLPFHFGMSGLNAGVSILELLGNDTSPALNRIGLLAAAAETFEGFELEVKRDPIVNEPLKRGVSGWITRAGGVLSGPLPLALRITAEFVSPHRARRLRRIAASSSIAGSLLTRIGWVRAGHASAKDWRLPLEENRKPRVQLMQSEAESPGLREIS